MADDTELLALLERSLAAPPVEPSAAAVAFQRRLVRERRALSGRSPFGKGLRVGVGLGLLGLVGVAGVAAASQGVVPLQLPQDQAPGSTATSAAVVPATPVPAATVAPAPLPPVPATTAPTRPGAVTTSPAPRPTVGSTPTTADDRGGRSGSGRSGSGSSGSGSSGSGSGSSGSGSGSSGSD